MIKTHINLASQGDYEFLTDVTFEDAQSECLRIKEVRLRQSMGEKPYPLPLKLLTWFTEHAPAGREITRDDTNQQNQAALYISLTDLKEQIETFTLKNAFTLELEISELDRNDESTVRNDHGFLTLEVNLYKGPKAGCTLKAESIAKDNEPFIYPINSAVAGRFDLATASLRADQGPLDPRTDKRVLLCDLIMPEAYTHLRHAMIERLRLFIGEQPALQHYVQDEHNYNEIFNAHPLDQRMQFPDGAVVFGPLLPAAPKEKNQSLTISMEAPFHDPFWQDLGNDLKAQNHASLTVELQVILPEPGGNAKSSIPLTIKMDDKDWLLVSDGAALGQPVIIPINRGNGPPHEDQSYTLRFPVKTDEPPVSAYIAVHYYGRAVHEQPVNISLTPSKKDTKYVTMKPEVIELTSNEPQMLLLNSFARNKKQKNQRSSFRLKCFWPERQLTETATITIERRCIKSGPVTAIDIGSAAITMAEKNGIIAMSTPLGQLAPVNYIDNCAIPSTLAITSGAPAGSNEEPEISESNWRTICDPLGQGYLALPYEDGALKARIEHNGHHYDIALPAAPANVQVPKDHLGALDVLNDLNALATSGIRHRNLKRLFSTETPPEHSEKGELYLKKVRLEDTEADAFLLEREIKRGDLLADCLTELHSYYGGKLNNEGLVNGAADDATQVNRDDAETEPEQEPRLNGWPATLIVTHPAHLTETGRQRYKTAAGQALANYEQGSFARFGPIAELLQLSSVEQCEARVHLVQETEAAAYHCLHQLALKEQPARARKVRLLHLDIGGAHLGMVALSGWIGETEALIQKNHGAVTLPLGGRALELALLKEISIILETANNNGAELSLTAPLPQTIEEIRAAGKGLTSDHKRQETLLTSLREGLIASGSKSNRDNDLSICLAKSGGQHWPLTLDLPHDYTGTPLRLWQGHRGEQLILTPIEQTVPEDKSKESEGVSPLTWQLELHLSTKRLSETVGPLSTYLAFVGEFLPLVLANCFPPEDAGVESRKAEVLISITGGTSLFAPIRESIKQSAKRLGCRLAFLPENYKEAATATATGALDMILNQKRSPYQKVRPNLILAPLGENPPAGPALNAIAASGHLAVIEQEAASGELPIGCSSVQLIETIPGLSRLMQQQPAALSCRHFMQDLDRASAKEWASAEAEWDQWLSQCHQVMLNMPVEREVSFASGENAAPDADAPIKWAFRALKENEASLSLGGHSYMIYTGLSNASL